MRSGRSFEGDEGLLEGLRPESIVVDTSTIGPDRGDRARSGEFRARGHWIDAPVSGSTALAEKGELTLWSAARRRRRACRAGARRLSAKKFHLGGAGAGAAMKLAVNSAIAVLNEAIAEGLVLAERRGSIREAAYDVFAGGALAAPYVLYKRDAFLRPEETPVAFTVSLMRKDLELALRLAEECRVEMRATRAADEMLARACEVELEDADFASVARVIREQ